MIREANFFDIPELVDAISDYYVESEYEKQCGVNYDPTSLERLCYQCISNSEHALFVATEKEDQICGLVMAMSSRLVQNLAFTCVQEIVCYGKQQEALRQHLDRWAKAMGHKCAIVSCFVGDDRFRKYAV